MTSIGRIGALCLTCLALSACSTLKELYELPNSYGQDRKVVDRKVEEPAASNACERQVVYRHRFSERVVYQQAERRADRSRMEQLEADVRRLSTDLQQAEKALIAVESKLTGAHTRAQAVRAHAETLSLLEVVANKAPWLDVETRHARQKLRDADKHIREGHYGAAILFASRAQRIASDIAAQAEAVRRAQNVSQVRVAIAVVRAKPERRSAVVVKLTRGTPVFPEKKEGGWVLLRTPRGKIGWMAGSLLESFPASPAR